MFVNILLRITMLEIGAAASSFQRVATKFSLIGESKKKERKNRLRALIFSYVPRRRLESNDNAENEKAKWLSTYFSPRLLSSLILLSSL